MFDYKISHSISVRRKFFDYKNEFPTGNTEVTVVAFKKYLNREDYFESSIVDSDNVCPIDRLGDTLSRFSKKYEVDIDINRIWDEEIDFYNASNELFIHAYSKKQKTYIRELMPYYNHQHFISKNRGIHQPIVLAKGDVEYHSKIIETREKSILFSVPLFGNKWLPKSTIYTNGDFYCLRKFIANQWDFSNL
ncbi:hypothetical protein [Photobacterium damselae]|uniref:hypothetical protein n=1 Tax=Photobacterium damselae TaxID=38293 RepID=UPI004067DDCA